MQLLVGECALFAWFAFPDDRSLVATRPVEMPIKAILCDINFAACKPLRKRRLPFQNVGPLFLPAQFLRLACPEFLR